MLGACLCLVLLSHAAEFGVGFGLAIDYGYVTNTITKMIVLINAYHSVVSVHFRDGSTVNIAKIEGTPAYKATMKTAPHLRGFSKVSWDASDADDMKLGCSNRSHFEHWKRERERAVAEMPHYPGMIEYLPSVRRYLPPWLGGLVPEHPDGRTQSLITMLRVLKQATEAYLDTEISNVSVAVPFNVECSWIRGSPLSTQTQIEAAASALDLRASWSEASSRVAWEERLSRPMERNFTSWECAPQDEALALVIDFSNAALTAQLQVRECDNSYSEYLLHSTELGAQKLFANKNWREVLAEALRRITVLPVPERNIPPDEDNPGATRFKDLDRISHLVLFGDSARDARLHEALRDFFGKQYDELIASAGDDGTPARDPVFRGAASSARLNWYNNHHHRLQGRPHDKYIYTPPGPLSHFWLLLRDGLQQVYNATWDWLRRAEDKEAEQMAALEQQRLIEERAQYPLLIGPPEHETVFSSLSRGFCRMLTLITEPAWCCQRLFRGKAESGCTRK